MVVQFGVFYEKIVIFVPNELAMVLISNIIYDFLADNRRITLPTIGTFITKGSQDEILFSEFVKGDDGVLRRLLQARAEVDESEAQRMVDEFVGSIHDCLRGGESYEVEGVGRLYMQGGAVCFESVGESQVIDSILDTLSTPEESVSEPVIKEEEPIEESIEESRTHYVESEAKPKYDVWLVVAIVVMSVAIIALLYGFFVEWQVGSISFGSTIDGVLESIF